MSAITGVDRKVKLLRFATFRSQLQRNVQSLVPTAHSQTGEGRPGASSQACSSREVMKRPEGDEMAVAVVQGLASLTSRTGTLVVIIGGLVRHSLLCCSGMFELQLLERLRVVIDCP